MFLFPLNKKKLIVSFIIGSVCMVGDKNTEDPRNHVANAICDNTAHALIGIFTWIGIFAGKTSKADIRFVFEIILCGLCSSLIDLDHFVAAKSFNLKDATKLKNRPFLHCTTLAVFIIASILTVSYVIKSESFCKFGWILTAAFLSHHIRDSKRRGFWLWPFGSTPPIPFLLYIISQMFLPQFLSIVISELFPLESFRVEPVSNIETV